LKTLVLLASCLTLGGFVLFRQHRSQENWQRVVAVKKVVAEIEKLGGEVTSAYFERRSPTWMEEQFDDVGGVDDPVRDLQITSVDLSGTGVTDAGLEHLEGLRNLKTLILSDTKITNAGLEHLKGLTNLGKLLVDYTEVTHEGVATLQKALPKCQIVRSTGGGMGGSF
jgi:hypothetical protein